MKRILLKGGSLSAVYLCNDNGRSFVRKQVSMVENREFGFYRWFTQLKKLQRLGKMFPDIFPEIIDIGTDGTMAYFDMEFIADAITLQQFLAANPPKSEIVHAFNKLIGAMDRLHSVKIKSFKGGLRLYIKQEVERALRFCMDEPLFKSFSRHKKIIFNGLEITPLLRHIDDFYILAEKHYKSPEECLTHGNITLENILYNPSNRRIVFIDLYEENYVDNIYNEYSQILQSCNSYYEVYNALPAVLKRNSVNAQVERSPGLDHFNNLFMSFLRKRLSKSELVVTKLYEVSQFTRMLPFKKHIAKDKMIFFYALASNLFDSINS